MSQSKADEAISAGGVKEMIFKPSGKVLWSVVGKDNEHWADPMLGFCTCKDFYFRGLSGGSECYHLKNIKQAINGSPHSVIELSDAEYVQLLSAITDDQWASSGRS